MILVTGALGRIGNATARALHSRGAAVKALVPSRSHVPGLAELGIPLAEGDYDDGHRLSAALDGVHTVVLLSRPSADLVAVQERVIDACATAGVQRIVKLSATGANATARSDAARWHWRIEQHLQRAPLVSCVVRPMRQMQELLHQLPLLLTSGMLVGCQGEGRVSEIDARDLGAVLAACAVADAVPDTPVLATGPVALDRWAMCELLSSAFGRPVRYVNCTTTELESTLLASGISPWQVHDLVSTEASAAEGAFDIVTDTVEAMTGRPPRRFEQFANELATALSYTYAPERAVKGTLEGVG
jgi:NAD(P)H dehydrogenase (quinone)